MDIAQTRPQIESLLGSRDQVQERASKGKVFMLRIVG
jgi:hypothetical protein